MLQNMASDQGLLFVADTEISIKHGNNTKTADAPSVGNGLVQRVKVEESTIKA